MAVLALKQRFSLKFMQCASIISSESFWKIYLHRWINLEFPWSSLKVVRTSTRAATSRLTMSVNVFFHLFLLCPLPTNYIWSHLRIHLRSVSGGRIKWSEFPLYFLLRLLTALIKSTLNMFLISRSPSSKYK